MENLYDPQKTIEAERNPAKERPLSELLAEDGVDLNNLDDTSPKGIAEQKYVSDALAPPKEKEQPIDELLAEDTGFIEGIDDTIEDAKATVVRVIGGGLLNAVEGTIDAVHDGAAALSGVMTDYGITEENLVDDREKNEKWSDAAYGKPQNMVESFAQTVVSFAIPYAGAAKMIKGAGALAAAQRIGTAAGIDAVISDPDNERLSNFVEESDIPLASPIAAMLAQDPDDSRAMSRAKTSLESVLIGIPFELAGLAYKSVYGTLKARKALKMGQTDDVAAATVKPKSADGVPDTGPTVTGVEEVEKKLAKEQTEYVANVAKAQARVKKARPAASAARDEIKHAEQTEFLNNLVSENKRGIITDEKLIAEGGKILEDPVLFAELLEKSRTAGTVLNGGEMIAVRQKLAEESAAMIKMVEGISTMDDVAKLTEPELALISEQISNTIDMHVRKAGSGGEMGRAFRAMQIPIDGATDSKKMEMVKNYVELMGGKDNLIGTIKAVKAALGVSKRMGIKNAEATGQLADAVKWMGAKGDQLGKAANAIIMENALGSFTTGVANAGGGVARNLEDSFILAPTARLMSKLFSTKNGVAAGEVSANITARYEGMFDGFRALKTYMKGGEVPADAIVKIKGRDSGLEHVGDLLGFERDGGMGMLMKVLGQVSATGSRLTVAGDIFNSNVAARGRLHQLITREAAQVGIVPGTKQYEAFARNVMSDKKKYWHFYESALDMAKETNFAIDLSSDKLFMGGTVKAIDKVFDTLDKVPGARTAALFTRFAANSANYSIERSPIALLSPRFRRDVLGGGALRDEALSRMVYGTAFMGIGGWLSANGHTNGTGSKNYESANAAKQMGVIHNSLQIGDTSFEFNRLFPLPAFLGASADVTQLLTHYDANDNPQAVEDLILGSGAIFASYFMPSTLVDLSEGVGLIQDLVTGKEARSSTASKMARLGDLMTPFSGLLKNAQGVARSAGVGDELKRDTRTMDPQAGAFTRAMDEYLNIWLSKNPIPGFSDSLPTFRNIITAKPIAIPNGWGPDVFSPIYTHDMKEAENDRVFKELVDLQVAAPFYDLNLPDGNEHLKLRKLPRSFTKSGVDVRMNPVQYDRYQELAAGVGAKQEFLQLETSPDSPSLAPGVLEQGLHSTLLFQIENDWPAIMEITGSDKNTRTAKVAVVHKIMNMFKNAAKQQMFQEFPEMVLDITDGNANKAEALGYPEDVVQDIEEQGAEAVDDVNQMDRVFREVDR